jgi:hypothetical protein
LTAKFRGERKVPHSYCVFHLYRMLGPNVLVCSSLETALQRLQEPPLAETIESAWVIGGSSVYKVCNCCMMLGDAVKMFQGL